jgi:hypothetical protein
VAACRVAFFYSAGVVTCECRIGSRVIIYENLKTEEKYSTPTFLSRLQVFESTNNPGFRKVPGSHAEKNTVR